MMSPLMVRVRSAGSVTTGFSFRKWKKEGSSRTVASWKNALENVISDKVIGLFGDNPWAAGYRHLSVLWGRSDLLPSLNEKVKRSIFPICWRTTVLKCLFFCSFHSWMAARNLSTATEIGSLFNNCMNLLPIIAPDELIAAASKVALFDMPKPTRRGFRSPIPLMR